MFLETFDLRLMRSEETRIYLQKFSNFCGFIIIIIIIWYFCIDPLVPFLMIRMVFDNIPLCCPEPR